MQEKIGKKLFVFEIIASKLVALIVSIKKRISLISSQCVNKQL